MLNENKKATQKKVEAKRREEKIQYQRRYNKENKTHRKVKYQEKQKKRKIEIDVEWERTFLELIARKEEYTRKANSDALEWTKRKLKEKTLKFQVQEMREDTDTIDKFKELEKALEETYRVVTNKIDVIVQKVNALKDEEIKITKKQHDDVEYLYNELRRPGYSFYINDWITDWHDLQL